MSQQPIAVAKITAQAFRAMEMSPISSFQDDSEQASSALEQYTIARDMVLESYDWSAAREIANLPPMVLQLPEIADPDLPYTYKLPAQALILRKVMHDRTRWRQDRRLIRADRAGGLNVRYTRRIDDEVNMPATLQTAVALQLAVLLSPRWVTTRTKRQALAEDLREALATARRNDAHSASAHRMDGRPDQPDWADEATQ